MLIIETNYGNFGSQQDLLKYMEKENLMFVSIHDIKYIFNSICYSKGIYTIDEIRKSC